MRNKISLRTLQFVISMSTQQILITYANLKRSPCAMRPCFRSVLNIQNRCLSLRPLLCLTQPTACTLPGARWSLESWLRTSGKYLSETTGMNLCSNNLFSMISSWTSFQLPAALCCCSFRTAQLNNS